MKRWQIGATLTTLTTLPVALVISCSNVDKSPSKNEEANDIPFINKPQLQPEQDPYNIPMAYPTPKQISVPTKLIYDVPEVLETKVPPKVMLDRSGQGVWTTNVEHTAVMKNGYSDGSSTIKRRQKVVVDIYETSLFRYAVDMTAFMGKDSSGNAAPITHKKIEEIVKIFEAHVNYGPGAHMVKTPHTYKYVDKMTLELFRSAPGIPGLSMGSTAGVELSLHKNFGNTFTMAALLLHEYGHHETLVDSTIFHDSKTYKSDGVVKYIDTFAKFRKDLQADPELAVFAKYFNDRYGYNDMDGYHIKEDINTPIGALKSGGFAFGGSKYTFSSAEFVTRAQMLLEMSEDKSTLINQIQYRGELTGFMAEFKKSPIDENIKGKFIKLFLNDIYPIDKFATEGMDRVIDERYKAVVDGIIATRSPESKPIDHVVVNMIAREGKRTTINVSKDQLRTEYGEFHFNTNFDNTIPEVSKQIIMYSIDTDKLSPEDAKEITEWLNLRAEVKFYDADNNLMQTTGHL